MNHENAVALVGMSCRLPGARDVAEYWHNLRTGADGISRFGTAELLEAGVDPALAAHPDFVPARGVISGGDLFDRDFFGYSAAEAASIDPQHRIFLECAAQAFDDAGIDPARAGQWTGVYAGCDITPPVAPGPADPALATQRIIGREKDFLATRVAYKLGLRGPAVTVQTACSTALVAVHQACRALLGYECDVALAGGASLRLPTAGGHLHQEGGILSPDGHCRAFDAEAAGTVNGEGVGVVVLKRLADALDHGDRIIAVIRGSAVNNDGGDKVGYTAPSVTGQRDVILTALAQAGVGAAEIGYVEAHGTGTPVGDPVELAALTAAFRESGGPDLRTGHCLIGTVKANIGHTGATAGIAGLIKAALMLQHRAFVPTPHFTRANPALELEGSPFGISTEHRVWESASPRLAGVSSFGIGGTNAHLILEEAPLPAAGRRTPAEAAEVTGATEGAGTPRALCLSAATPEALHTLRERLADRLAADDAPVIQDVAHTLTERRRFPHRLTVVADSSAQAADRLRAADRTTRALPGPGAAFLFPGQGTLRAGQGRAAHALLPVFREVFEECRADCRTRFGVDLGRVLDPGTDRDWFTDTRHQQLGLFAHGCAMAAQLASWGITPAAMYGHSVGEYVAAAVAGVWSREDALGLVWERATAMHEAGPGSMLALRLPPSEAAPLLGDGVALAVAGTGHVVLSGPAARIEQLALEQGARGVAARLLDTVHAFHSPLMTGAADSLRRAVAAVPARAPQVPYVSNPTGTWAEADRAGDPGYWADQLLGTIRLEEGMRTLAGAGARLLIELGPGDSLTREAARQAVDAVPVTLFGRHPEQETTALLSAVARLWEEGLDVPWETLEHPEPAARCSLPPHPFAPTPTGSHARLLPVPGRAPVPAIAAAPLTTPTWSQTPTARPGAYDGVLLVGDAEPGLESLAASALADASAAPAAVIRTPWQPGSPGAATAALAASGTRTPLVLAALPPAADPTDPGTSAVLDTLAATARRLGAPLLLAGHALTGILAEHALSPGAAALTAWAEHQDRSALRVALLDLGAGPGPSRLPALDGPAACYAWRGRSWWARTARSVPVPPVPVSGAAAAASTSPERAPARWTLIADGRPDGAGLAADLAGHGLPLVAYVDLAPDPDRTGLFATAVADAPWNSAEPPLTRRSRLGRDLDRYCAGLIGRQFLSLTGLSGGQRRGDEDLRRRIDPEDRLPALVGFCLRMLAEEGWLRREEDGWYTADDIAEGVADALRAGDGLGELPGLTRMLDHVTDAYPAVFAGRRTPVSVLYPDAEDDFLHTCLMDNRVPLDENAAALDALRTVVRDVTARRDDDRPLRVLEIGAGTGRLTWPLLTDWPGRHGVEYHFTDISPLIVRRAQTRAAELGLPDMRFSTYDIGQDPAAQGLVPGSYDLVLGYNVVHATPSVPVALRHLAGLLRPGGRVGLVEVTDIPRWSHVLWGLAPGWWGFADELRTDSIHLDAKTWLRALDEAGFADARPVPASLDSDHLVVLAARPADADARPVARLRRTVAGLPRTDGADALLYVPGLEHAPQAAARWEELRTAVPATGPAWVVTDDPADWRAQQVRRLLDPDPDSPAWGHLEIPRTAPADMAALLGSGLPPGTLRLTGPLSRPGAPEDVPPLDPVRPARGGTAGAPGPVASSEEAAPRPTRDALAAAVADLWCEVLGTPAAAERDDFHLLGGDSLMLVQLTGLVRSRLGHRVSAVSLPRELTFAGLVAAVRQAAPAAVTPPAADAVPDDPAPAALPSHLTLLREGGPGTPLFLVPPASGSSLCYRHLAGHLDDTRPVYGIESPGLHDGRRPPTRLEDLAAHHVSVIRRIRPQGPYLLGGWSYGAMVAHEMTRLLEATGERVELLLGIDGFLPPTKGLPVGALPSWLLPSVRLQLEARFQRGRALLLGAGRWPGADRDRVGRLGEVARIGDVAGLTTDGSPDYVRVHNASITAMLRHRPRPVAGGLLLLKAGADATVRARLTGRLAALYGAGAVVRSVPGDHWTVLGRTHAPALAAEIRRALAATRA
ncbi:type I polyketide synthase [Streptomyces sp. ISL-11]|uniref:type I polyketide synthase n=1 Tax=Streptomyces sp. ISL-11 TaxID=2819174 RepID=UPI001BE97EBD|nr:type I polyketide synthase [Streptomyces sp. ISL-11]MBT2382950.1 acyltransferase domain-containing protein [Streptomyces sp. ISL-11]